MSYIAWVDFDPEARQQARELMALLNAPEARDEFGISQLRDGIADLLFPGTSTIHTRLRYMLFVPWLVKMAQSRGGDAADEFKRFEVALIQALKNGEMTDGVIGRDAGSALKRFPSSVYWAALERLGIRQMQSSIQSALSDNMRERQAQLWHPDMPNAPKRLLTTTDFTLLNVEKEFIIGRLTEKAPNSLFSEIILSPNLLEQIISGDPETHLPPWELQGVSDQNRQLLQHARILSDLMHGAAVLYNLLLMRKAAQDENAKAHAHAAGRVESLEQDLADWQALARPELANWNVNETAKRVARPVNQRTKDFVAEWQTIISENNPLSGSVKAHDLLRRREQNLKGRQKKARLTFDDALRRWGGQSGLETMLYRWPIAKGYIMELVQ